MEFHAPDHKFSPTCTESRWVKKKTRLSFGGYNGPLLGDTSGGGLSPGISTGVVAPVWEEETNLELNLGPAEDPTADFKWQRLAFSPPGPRLLLFNLFLFV